MPNIIYKEIDQLSKKDTIAGTEKIVVSDTEYVTPNQIAGLADVSGKQDTLVSGVNIKTINNLSILGSGNLNIEGGGGGGSVEWGNIGGTLADQGDLNTALAGKQATLVSGTNIKTINNQDILGSGNITISGGGSNIEHLDDESELPANPDPDTLYVIDESGSIIGESTVNKVTSLSASSTDVQYPSAKCVYDEITKKQDVIDVNNKIPYSNISGTPDLSVFPKYYVCASEAEYIAIQNKDSSTLYLIPETSE